MAEEKSTQAQTGGGNVPAMTADSYRVLARKYRPSTFAELIGQEAMVRTLKNAIAQGRIAQAYLLAGARGVGKTTTARLIAKALNCIGPDGGAGPSIDPCGQCRHCRAIAEDRHPDVIELDAASRTGVDHIRELIEGVRYLPIEARLKVYILDEVHMLSEKAFNALLKTLEEPPAHVKFVFCTTEARKVPPTVLSRCQRFDLRRVEAEALIAHLAQVARAEGAEVEPEAYALIARAAEGSVRDGLSLLDQAIAHSGGQMGGRIGAEAVRDMLGLADRGRVFDLLEDLIRGRLEEALANLRLQYDAGCDPSAVFRDLLDLANWIARVKVVAEAAEDASMAEPERSRARALAGSLGMPELARLWQMLLKGLAETQTAPNPIAAAEMALIRIGYAADLPAPADLIRLLDQEGQGAHKAQEAGQKTPPSAKAEGIAQAPVPLGPAPGPRATPKAYSSQGAAAPKSAPEPVLGAERAPYLAAHATESLADFASVVALFREKREPLLHAHLVNDVVPVQFEEGRIVIRPKPQAPRALAGQVAGKLSQWTGRRWVVALTNEDLSEDGGKTLAEQEAERADARKSRILGHPLVQKILGTFPGAELIAVHDLRPLDTDREAPEDTEAEPESSEET